VQYEARGIPAVLLKTRNYSATVQYSAEASAIPALRQVFFQSLPQAFQDHGASAAYVRERIVRPEFDYILAALVDPLNDYERNISFEPEGGFLRDPIYVPSTTPEAQALYAQFSNNRIGPGGVELGPFMGGRRGMDPSQSGHDLPGNRIRNVQSPTGIPGINVPLATEFHYVDNHNYPNSWIPSNRYPFSSSASTIARDWNALNGDDLEDMQRLGVNAVANPEDDTITFYGTSYEDVYNQFQIYAQEFHISDGLPLIPPTREMVDDMLRGTTRLPDEVVGGSIVGRGGLPTVEKIAINAVMAGALPEHLPIIIAGVEMISQDDENRTAHFHGHTSGGHFGYMMIVSGPIVEEIGLNTGAGYLGGAGHPVNNTIGRAFRISLRNIGNNWLGYQDTPRAGRLHETIYPVIAEDESALPPGWQTYREQMGFRKDQSIVGIQCLSSSNEQTTDSTGVDQAWDAHSLIRNLRFQDNRSIDLVVMIGPAHAAALYDAGWADVNTVRQNTSTTAYPFPPGFVNGIGSANNVNPRALNTWIIVTGEDPTRATSFASVSHGQGSTFANMLLTGAPLSNVVNDLPPPAVPQNFTVDPGPVPGTAILTWDPPAVTAGRQTITHYEVTAQTRRNNLERWVQVPGGADARTTVLTHLDGGNSYTFRVRAVGGGYPTAVPTAPLDEMYYFGGRRIPLVNGAPTTGAFPAVNVYTAWDSDAFATGVATASRNLGVVPWRGAIASVHWSEIAVGNGVMATAPSEVFWITGRLNADGASIDAQWRTPWSDGGLPITGYEFSTDNGRTWLPMDDANGRDLVLPWAEGAIPGVNAGVRHKRQLYDRSSVCKRRPACKRNIRYTCPRSQRSRARCIRRPDSGSSSEHSMGIPRSSQRPRSSSNSRRHRCSKQRLGTKRRSRKSLIARNS
jgi:hypothetical protein